MSEVTMSDVRIALFRAYKKLAATEGGVDGKLSEGYCELLYPNYWDCKTEEEFSRPDGLMVYSYALGPSRQHYFYYNEKEEQVNYYTWRSKDIYAKAIEVINQWMEQIGKNDE